MDTLLELDANSFEAEVLACEIPVLVDFWSHTCPHCLLLEPDFARAAEKYRDQVKFVKVSVQAARELFSKYGVNAVPTLVFFRAGEVVARREGAASSEEIAVWLAGYL